MMMYDLPLDLVEEILYRVPAISMKRLRSTCKRWNALFKDQRFTEKHFRRAPKESMVLMLKEYKVFSMSVNLNVAPPSIALALKDSHSYLGEADIHDVIHCDGLLLCITKDNRAVVWNPCLGETRWIQLNTSKEEDFTFVLGYEKKKSGHNYKILMYRDNDDDISQERVNGFEINELSSDSWRVFENVVMDFSIRSANYYLSLKGNSYCLAVVDDENKIFLLCFDFTAERFKRMCLPPLDVDQMSLSVVGETKLSVLSRINSTSKMEIWITNKIDTDIEAVLKWCKSFTVDIPVCRNYSSLFLSFIINEEKKVALCCDNNPEIRIIGEDDEFYTEILYAKSTNRLLWWQPFIFSYVPSLVQI